VTIILIVIITPFSGTGLRADEISVKGQASGGFTLNGDDWSVGLRYIPGINLSKNMLGNGEMDAEISLNIYTSAQEAYLRDIDDNADIEPYRSWARFSTHQFEIRLGLQKINFGPAKILRSLKWFDRVDERDPLKMTDGVYALLTRYYFLNNANIWGWVLYGNEELKGTESCHTDEHRLEFGGRCQVPVSKGELALTFNRRYVDREKWNQSDSCSMDWSCQMSEFMSDGTENRFALDGSFDIGAGLWFEACAGRLKINEKKGLWQEFFTFGADYTFGIGPGIHILCEHFIKSSGERILKQGDSLNISALSVDFSIGVMDTLKAIGYYNWDPDRASGYIGWQRTYNSWLINISLFSNPKDELSRYKDTGLEFMITYNH